MANLPLPNAGLGFVEEGEIFTSLQVNQVLWRAQQMIVEMTNVLDVEKRDWIRQEDLIQVLCERVVQQGEQLQQYNTVVRSQAAAQSSEAPQIETMPNQGNISLASSSRLPEAAIPALGNQPFTMPPQLQAYVSLPRATPVKLEMPKPFGNRKDQDVSDWILQTTIFFSASELDEGSWGLRVAINLEGEVLTWYHSLVFNPRHFSWNDLSQGLLQSFRSPDFEVSARDTLETCKQIGSVSGYVAALHRALVRCTNTGQDESLHKFVCGLKQECCAYIRLQGPQNFQSAYQMADKFESSQDDPDRQIKPDRSKHDSNWNPSQYDKGKSYAKSSSKAEGKRPQKTNSNGMKKFSGNCFVCGKPGHRAQECYRKTSSANAKGKATAAQGGPQQENE